MKFWAKNRGGIGLRTCGQNKANGAYKLNYRFDMTAETVQETQRNNKDAWDPDTPVLRVSGGKWTRTGRGDRYQNRATEDYSVTLATFRKVLTDFLSACRADDGSLIPFKALTTSDFYKYLGIQLRAFGQDDTEPTVAKLTSRLERLSTTLLRPQQRLKVADSQGGTAA